VSAKKPSKKKKHQATSDEKELKRAAKRLGTELERSDARVEHWKRKAGRAEKKVAELETKVKKLTKKLRRATAVPAEPLEPTEPVRRPELVAVPEPGAPATSTTSTTSTTPDASWTVVQLRAEARSRGLTGLSGKTKAQLLDALS
jgi:hypothetical protein